MARSLTEIETLERTLLAHAPNMRDEIQRLAAIARDGLAPATYVAVTDSLGVERVMTADEYTRMSATDLAHVSLRVLDEATARGMLGA